MIAHPGMLTRTLGGSRSPHEITVTLNGLGTLSGEVWSAKEGSTTPSDRIVRFLNVPYAAPPVGKLRWRPPQPPLPWDGVRRNPARLSMCPQPDGGLPGVGTTFLGRRVEESEEGTLVLDICAPAPPDVTVFSGGVSPTGSKPASPADGATPRVRASASSRPYPVIVYIHGGAGKLGTAHVDETSGDALASREVVYVCINYRLGLFGFFAHPALSCEDDADAAAADIAAGNEPSSSSSSSGGGGRKKPQPRACGNYAILDMIQALEWVQVRAHAQTSIARQQQHAQHAAPSFPHPFLLTHLSLSSLLSCVGTHRRTSPNSAAILRT